MLTVLFTLKQWGFVSNKHLLPERCSVTSDPLETHPGYVPFMIRVNDSFAQVYIMEAKSELVQVHGHLSNQGSERWAYANLGVPEFTYQDVLWARRDSLGSPHACWLDSPPPHLQGLW